MKKLEHYQNSEKPKDRSYALKVLYYFTDFIAIGFLCVMLVGSIWYWKDIMKGIQPAATVPILFWIGIISAIIYSTINWASFFINDILEMRNETR